jgi:pyruvate/2-oxoacid:ferredoxin oxidoreductase alpha subunit
VIDEWRERGKKVGLVKMRLFRPFPVEDVRRICRGAKKIAVIDRNIGFSIGGIWAQEIRAALYGSGYHRPVFGYIAGIGGRDVTPDTVSEILEHVEHLEKPDQDVYWIGVKHEPVQSAR